jgi:hypothetical protein
MLSFKRLLNHYKVLVHHELRDLLVMMYTWDPKGVVVIFVFFQRGLRHVLDLAGEVGHGVHLAVMLLVLRGGSHTLRGSGVSVLVTPVAVNLGE